jgi:hypothetical protein
MNNKSTINSNSIDIICLGFVALLLALTLIFAEKVAGWRELANGFLIAGMLYLSAVVLVHRLPKGFFATAVHTTAVLALFGFLFDAVDGLQHIIVEGWMDDALISLEYSLIGTESSLFLQQFTNPILTETMMFAYVIYVPLLPLTALICYCSKKGNATNEYLSNLSLANIVCYIGFILFPVASPLYHWPELYTVSLDGGFFTWCGEWMRQNQHYAGGSLPSPHCAAATVMLAMLHRHSRRLFYLALPTILMLYVSTVYGRYHYAWDGVAGILTAVAVLKWNPKVVASVELLRAWLRRLWEAHTVPTSVSELN